MGDNSDSKTVGKWGPRQTQNLDPNRQWAASRRRYEWKDTYDGEDFAPKDEDLENELFGEENHVHTGINFSQYQKIKVTVRPEGTRPIESFDEADLHPMMKDNVKLANYSVPTPVQRYSIPIITDGNDLMACAQTGSGKTAAFLIPTLSKLFGKAKKSAASRSQSGNTRRFKAEPLILIIAPTRELATQIFDECRRFTYRSMMRPCVVYGGAEVSPQKSELAKGCDVLTATPGRLNDFLERGIVSLRKVKYLVLDEADRMLDMGFENDIRKIVQKSDLCDDRQTLMFSATFPRQIRSLAKDFLAENYVFLTVGRVGGTTSDITQKIMYVEDHNKRNSLVELLLKQPPSRTLIFVETKRGADSLDDFLYNQNFPTTSIHGDRSQREREDALISFKNGKSPILIATAVAARGLDIKNVMHVINYDLCKEIDEYVHRIGRTARVGNKGLATTFYNERNSDIAPDIVRILVECEQDVPDFLQQHTARKYDDEDEEGISNYAKNTQDNKGYSTWDSGKTSWDNNNQATSNSNNQNAGWDSGKNWENPIPPWESNPPQTQKPVQPYTAPQQPIYQQPPHQSFQSPPQSFQKQSPSYQGPPQQQQGMAQYAHSEKPSLPSQYPQNQYGGAQPVVNLPRTTNQHPQNTYGSYGAGGYGSHGGPPNNNPQQDYYNPNPQGNSGLNDRDQRRRNNVNERVPAPNSDSWDSNVVQTQPRQEWDETNVPWS